MIIVTKGRLFVSSLVGLSVLLQGCDQISSGDIASGTISITDGSATMLAMQIAADESVVDLNDLAYYAGEAANEAREALVKAEAAEASALAVNVTMFEHTVAKVRSVEFEAASAAAVSVKDVIDRKRSFAAVMSAVADLGSSTHSSVAEAYCNLDAAAIQSLISSIHAELSAGFSSDQITCVGLFAEAYASGVVEAIDALNARVSDAKGLLAAVKAAADHVHYAAALAELTAANDAAELQAVMATLVSDADSILAVNTMCIAAGYSDAALNAITSQTLSDEECVAAFSGIAGSSSDAAVVASGFAYFVSTLKITGASVVASLQGGPRASVTVVGTPTFKDVFDVIVAVKNEPGSGVISVSAAEKAAGVDSAVVLADLALAADISVVEADDDLYSLLTQLYVSGKDSSKAEALVFLVADVSIRSVSDKLEELRAKWAASLNEVESLLSDELYDPAAELAKSSEEASRALAAVAAAQFALEQVEFPEADALEAWLVGEDISVAFKNLRQDADSSPDTLLEEMDWRIDFLLDDVQLLLSPLRDAVIVAAGGSPGQTIKFEIGMSKDANEPPHEGPDHSHGKDEKEMEKHERKERREKEKQEKKEKKEMEKQERKERKEMDKQDDKERKEMEKQEKKDRKDRKPEKPKKEKKGKGGKEDSEDMEQPLDNGDDSIPPPELAPAE